MEKTKQKSNNKIVVLAVLWLVTYSICLLTIKKISPGLATGVILSFLIASMDEVEIRIQMEAAVIAFSLGLLMLMTLGLLDLVVTLSRENWGFRHLIPYFVIFYFIGLFISKRKYN